MLANQRSFALTSQALDLSPHVLKQHVRALEKALGYKVFVSWHEPLNLSHQGETLRLQSLGIQAEAQAVERLILRHTSPCFQDTLVLGWHPIWEYFLSPETLANFCQSLTETQFHFFKMADELLQSSLLSHDLHLALSSRKLSQLPHQQRVLLSDYVIVSAHANSLRDWRELEYIQVCEQPALEWDEARFPRDIAVTTNHLSIAFELLRSGLDALYVPHAAVVQYLKRGELHIAALPPEPKVCEGWLSAATPEHLRVGQRLVANICN